MLSEYSVFIIILLAVACGWFVGGWQSRNRSKNEPLDRENYELPYYFSSDTPDYALDAFISAVDVNSDTLETHLALGAIHRRRGELDRAIRIHENLVCRDGLNQNQVSLAKFELAMDYLKAGLNDRAEGFLQELVEKSDSHKVSALYLLIELYQSESEWRRACHASEALSRFLDKEGRERLSHRIAHFYCEEAEKFITSKDYLGARNAIKQAESLSSITKRPGILMAELQLQLGYPKKAQELLEPIIIEASELQEKMIELMANICHSLDKPEMYVSILEKAYRNHPSSHTLVLLAQELTLLNQQDNLLCIVEELPPDDIASMPIRLFSELDDKLLNRLGVLLINSLTNDATIEDPYQCHDCGFETREYYWQCPSCHHWETLRTRNRLNA